jgi:hypothetical protein
MARRRKIVYPPAKTATKGGAAGPQTSDRPSTFDRMVTIDVGATAGQPSIRERDRVRIAKGLYAGEVATVESLVGGVIPAAVLRMSDGKTRRARTIDLVREPAASAPADVERPAEDRAAG